MSAPRPRAASARERGSSEAAAATRTGRSSGLSRRMATHVAAHQSNRGPARRGAPTGRDHVLEPGEGEEGEAQLQPGVGGVPRIVAPHRHAADRLRAARPPRPRDVGRGAGVADPPEGLRRAAAHLGVGVRERRQEPVHRRAVAGEAEGERGHPPDLRPRGRSSVDEGRDERGVGHAARGEGGAAAHAPVGSRRSRSSSPAPDDPRVLQGEDARQLVDARGGGGGGRASSRRARPGLAHARTRTVSVQPRRSRSHHPPIIASARARTIHEVRPAFLVNGPIRCAADPLHSARPKLRRLHPVRLGTTPHQKSRRPFDGPERIIHSEDGAASVESRMGAVAVGSGSSCYRLLSHDGGASIPSP